MPVTGSSRTVFLSYDSQDAEAAQQVAEAFRASTRSTRRPQYERELSRTGKVTASIPDRRSSVPSEEPFGDKDEDDATDNEPDREDRPAPCTQSHHAKPIKEPDESKEQEERSRDIAVDPTATTGVCQACQAHKREHGRPHDHEVPHRAHDQNCCGDTPSDAPAQTACPIGLRSFHTGPKTTPRPVHSWKEMHASGGTVSIERCSHFGQVSSQLHQVPYLLRRSDC